MFLGSAFLWRWVWGEISTLPSIFCTVKALIKIQTEGDLHFCLQGCLSWPSWFFVVLLIQIPTAEA